jgi:hypothetical protein
MNPVGFEPTASISAESRSYPLSYGFKSKDERGKLNDELKAFYFAFSVDSSSFLFWRKVWESNPQERLISDGFQDRLACPCPTFQFWRKSWELNPHRLISPATLAASCHTN